MEPYGAMAGKRQTLTVQHYHHLLQLPKNLICLVMALNRTNGTMLSEDWASYDVFVAGKRYLIAVLCAFLVLLRFCCSVF
jgi:hypothetical protein